MAAREHFPALPVDQGSAQQKGNTKMPRRASNISP